MQQQEPTYSPSCDCIEIGTCCVADSKTASDSALVQMTGCLHHFHRPCLEMAERVDHPEVPVDQLHARCPRCRLYSEVRNEVAETS